MHSTSPREEDTCHFDAKEVAIARPVAPGVDDAALSIAPAGKGRALLAAACIGLGFVVLALFALLKE